jgi:hypothetical protein
VVADMSSLSEFFGGSAAKWVSGRSYVADSLAWSPISYLTYVCINATSGTTDPSADSTNWAIFGPSRIRNIQRGTITIAASTTSGTATLGSSVNTSKSTVTLLGYTTNTNSQLEEVRISLTDSTTVTATKGIASTAVTVSYEVVQWW